jgi:hypothetical protein
MQKRSRQRQMKQRKAPNARRRNSQHIAKRKGRARRRRQHTQTAYNNDRRSAKPHRALQRELGDTRVALAETRTQLDAARRVALPQRSTLPSTDKLGEFAMQWSAT